MGMALQQGPTPLRARRGRPTDSSWTTGRRLVVVDLENVVGGLCSTEGMTRWGRRVLQDRRLLRAGDHVVVGVDEQTLPTVAWDWTRARLVPGRHQRDGADLALLAVLEEDVARRFAELVLVSGDGIFADAVTGLTAQGVEVTVAAHECALSPQLRTAASQLVLLSRAN